MDDAKNIWKALKQRSQDTLGDEFWKDMANLLPNQGPKADLYQTETHLVAVLELPGLARADQVRMSIKGKTLYIQGEIPSEYPGKEEDLIFSERSTGKFKRKVALPQEVWPHSVYARYKNGLLHVYMKKKPEEEEWPVNVEFVPDEPTGGPHG
jgi:HSP20 family protein